MARKSRVLTDHDEIRSWAEERDAQPSCVRGTGSEEDVGMIRLDFPGYSGETSLEPIEWDEWLQKFDENNLALLVEDETARGEKSNFNKIVGRETAEGENRAASRTRSRRGARATAKRSGSRSAAKRGASSRSRSGRSTSTRGSSRRGARSTSKRTTTTGKKRAQSARGNSRSRSRRGAA